MAKQPAASDRRARAAALMAQQKRAEQRRKALIMGIPAIVVVVVVAVIVIVSLSRNSSTAPAPSTSGSVGLDVSQQIIPATPTGTPVVQQAPKKVANTTGINGVIAYDTAGYPGPGTASSGTLQHDHVYTPVTYAVTPPVGGPHNPIWMNAGIYTEPVPSERAVHNLEHGAVWITYRPSLDASSVTALQNFVNSQSLIPEVDSDGSSTSSGQANRFVDLSPWASDDLPAPIVISSWGYQLRVTSPTDPRLQQFVDTFRNSKQYTPEYGSPVDGIPVQTGGRPAADGGAKPNPAGSVPQS